MWQLKIYAIRFVIQVLTSTLIPSFPSFLKQTRKKVTCSQCHPFPKSLASLFFFFFGWFKQLWKFTFPTKKKSVLNSVKFNEYYWPAAIVQAACWDMEDTQECHVQGGLSRLRPRSSNSFAGRRPRRSLWRLTLLTTLSLHLSVSAF